MLTLLGACGARWVDASLRSYLADPEPRETPGECAGDAYCLWSVEVGAGLRASVSSGWNPRHACRTPALPRRHSDSGGPTHVATCVWGMNESCSVISAPHSAHNAHSEILTSFPEAALPLYMSHSWCGVNLAVGEIDRGVPVRFVKRDRRVLDHEPSNSHST